MAHVCEPHQALPVMGNSSKLILAIPFALNWQALATAIIKACGVRHTITIDTDELLRSRGSDGPRRKL